MEYGQNEALQKQENSETSQDRLAVRENCIRQKTQAVHYLFQDSSNTTVLRVSENTTEEQKSNR